MYIHISSSFSHPYPFCRQTFSQGLETKNHPHPICLWIFQTARPGPVKVDMLLYDTAQSKSVPKVHPMTEDANGLWQIQGPSRPGEKKICIIYIYIPHTLFTKRYTELVVVFAVAKMYIYIYTLGFKSVRCETQNSQHGFRVKSFILPRGNNKKIVGISFSFLLIWVEVGYLFWGEERGWWKWNWESLLSRKSTVSSCRKIRARPHLYLITAKDFRKRHELGMFSTCYIPSLKLSQIVHENPFFSW